jgi:hypothetical protein
MFLTEPHVLDRRESGRAEVQGRREPFYTRSNEPSGNGNGFSVALYETSIQMCQLKTSARYAHRRIGKVDRRVMGACASEPFGIAAASTTDFEPS